MKKKKRAEETQPARPRQQQKNREMERELQVGSQQRELTAADYIIINLQASHEHTACECLCRAWAHNCNPFKSMKMNYYINRNLSWRIFAANFSYISNFTHKHTYTYTKHTSFICRAPTFEFANRDFCSTHLSSRKFFVSDLFFFFLFRFIVFVLLRFPSFVHNYNTRATSANWKLLLFRFRANDVYLYTCKYSRCELLK